MSKILVKTENLFIGDILFGSSVANPLERKVLSTESGLMIPTSNEIHFSVDLLQPLEILQLNPHIRKVFYGECEDQYDDVFTLKSLACQDIPATIQFKNQLGLKTNEYAGYSVDTNPSNDYSVNLFYKQYRSQGKKIVVVQNNWFERTFGFTREEYWRGVNVAPVGYGGRRRDIPSILARLAAEKDLVLIPVGKDNGYNQRNGDIYSSTSYAFTASLIKMADVFIGSEGGLSNLAAPNTRCIITTDFIAQLYGANGCIRKHQKPTMGPATYFPEQGHVHLDPYLTDNEVAEQIIYYIKNAEKYHVFDWNTL